MKNDTTNQPRLFDDTKLTFEHLMEFKDKLVWATTHTKRAKANQKLVSAPYAGAAKHYAKLGSAMAEAIRLKSTIPLEQELGPGWEKDVQELRPLYTKFDEDQAAAVKLAEERSGT